MSAHKVIQKIAEALPGSEPKPDLEDESYGYLEYATEGHTYVIRVIQMDGFPEEDEAVSECLEVSG